MAVLAARMMLGVQLYLILVYTYFCVKMLVEIWMDPYLRMLIMTFFVNVYSDYVIRTKTFFKMLLSIYCIYLVFISHSEYERYLDY